MTLTVNTEHRKHFTMSRQSALGTFLHISLLIPGMVCFNIIIHNVSKYKAILWNAIQHI